MDEIFQLLEDQQQPQTPWACVPVPSEREAESELPAAGEGLMRVTAPSAKWMKVKLLELDPSLPDFCADTVTPFVMKCFYIVSDQSTDFCIRWDPQGHGFMVIDECALAHSVLPRFFRHKNMPSFVRQLNKYCFRKCNRDGLRCKGGELFSHPQFQQGQPQLLSLITPRNAALEPPPRPSATPETPPSTIKQAVESPTTQPPPTHVCIVNTVGGRFAVSEDGWLCGRVQHDHQGSLTLTEFSIEEFVELPPLLHERKQPHSSTFTMWLSEKPALSKAGAQRSHLLHDEGEQLQQQAEVDQSTKEDRLRDSNREAARKSRKRRKLHIEELETQVQRLARDCATKRQRVAALMEEQEQLQRKLQPCMLAVQPCMPPVQPFKQPTSTCDDSSEDDSMPINWLLDEVVDQHLGNFLQQMA